MIIDFIQNSIADIFKTFPNLNECIYSYDKYSNTHFIKIESLSVYNSEDFAKLDADISIKFYELGVEGSLCFISSESQVDLMNPLSFFNSIIPENSKIIDGVLNFNIADIFYVHSIMSQNILIQDMFTESFNPDNSITYSLAA